MRGVGCLLVDCVTGSAEDLLCELGINLLIQILLELLGPARELFEPTKRLYLEYSHHGETVAAIQLETPKKAT